MLSTANQKARPFAAFGAVSMAPKAAGVGRRHVDQIGQRPVVPHGHDGFECLVDREAERGGIDAHANRIGLEARAPLGEGERLSKFARDRIALIRAERRAADAARAERRRKAKSSPKNHLIRLPKIEPAGAETRQCLDTISRDGARQTATIVGLLIFLIAFVMASLGDGGGSGLAAVIAAIF
jgi:hypothetical protein